jgi:DNA-binding XRE family transcriptional regulator
METWDKIKDEVLASPEVRREYDRLGPRYEIISLLIDARNKLGLTQSELAARIGTKQTAIARFESGSYNPSLKFLEKVADGLGKKVIITLQ